MNEYVLAEGIRKPLEADVKGLSLQEAALTLRQLVSIAKVASDMEKRACDKIREIEAATDKTLLVPDGIWERDDDIQLASMGDLVLENPIRVYYNNHETLKPLIDDIDPAEAFVEAMAEAGPEAIRQCNESEMPDYVQQVKEIVNNYTSGDSLRRYVDRIRVTIESDAKKTNVRGDMILKENIAESACKSAQAEGLSNMNDISYRVAKILQGRDVCLVYVTEQGETSLESVVERKLRTARKQPGGEGCFLFFMLQEECRDCVDEREGV